MLWRYDPTRNVIIGVRDPLKVLELYLSAGLLMPVERFLSAQKEWIARLPKAENCRLEELIEKAAQLRQFESIHGEGAAIDLGHSFMKKMLWHHERKSILPEYLLENAERANHQ